MKAFPPFALGLVLSAVANAESGVSVLAARALPADAPAPLRLALEPGVAPALPAAPEAVPPAPLPGWPRIVGAQSSFSPVRGPVFADLDRDGRQEVIASSTDGNVYVWDVAGNAPPGWPRALIGFPQYPAAVGDLDGDGVFEIVQTSRGLTSGGRLYVLRADGSDYPGWPLNLNNNNVEFTPALADLDFDGKLEIVVGERAWPIGRLHVLRENATPFPGAWPFTLNHVPALSAAVADVDADGALEIVYASYTTLYVFEADGSVVPGWPYDVSALHNARFSYQSPALADLDGNGTLEIATACHWTGSGCYVFRSDGTLLPGWPKSFGGTWSYSPPTLCDLEGDGAPEVICGVSGGTAAGSQVFAWTASGVPKTGFPVVGPGGAEGPLVVADLDASFPGKEIVFDSNLVETATNQGWLSAVDATGAPLPDWPLRPTGFTYMNGSTIGDVDGDGKPEIATTTHSGTSAYVYLWRVDVPFGPARVDWWCYRESILRTGRAGKGHRNQEIGDVSLGGAFNAYLKGAPGGFGALFLGFAPAAYPLPPAGVIQIEILLSPIALFAGALATGQAVVPLTVPNDPSLLGADLFFQGVEFTTPADLSLTDMRSVEVQ